MFTWGEDAQRERHICAISMDYSHEFVTCDNRGLTKCRRPAAGFFASHHILVGYSRIFL